MNGMAEVEALAQALKAAEAKHSSLERSMLFHREVAEDLLAAGYGKLPEGDQDKWAEFDKWLDTP